MDGIELPLAQVVFDVTPQALSDLYIQLHNLVKLVNQRHAIVQSPNGHYWRITVNNSGALSSTDLGLTLP